MFAGNKKLFLILTAGFLGLAFMWPWDAPKKPAASPPAQGQNPVPKKNAGSKQENPDTGQTPEAANPDEAQEVSTVPAVPEISRVQNQIQKVIQLNETLKTRYHNQAGEIDRISEQARIHQRILNNLTVPPRPSLAPIDAQEILRQEKIRVISSETQRNQEFLQNLERTRRASR